MRTLLLSLLLTSGVVARPLQLDFEVEKTRKPVDGQAESTRFPLQVLLGDGVLHYKDGGGDTLHDFNALRTYHWTDQSRDEFSLFAIAGGRQREMENRRTIGQALTKANKAEPTFSEVLLEHVFAMNIPGGTQAPEFAAAGELKATVGEKLLAQASSEGEATDAQGARAYARFLRYYVSAHPDFLSRVEAAGKLPTKVTVVQYGLKEERRYQLTLKVVSPEITLAATAPPAPAAPSQEGRQLDRLLRRVNAIPTSQATRRNQATLQRAEADRKAKKYLPAVLRYFDYFLSAGRSMPDGFTKSKATFAKAPDTKALFAALDQSATAPKVALARLQSLEKKAPDVAYILYIFRAGIVADTQSPKAGLELYLKALEKQPLVTGAWKDAGDIFYRAYLAEEAWKCWDAAMRLARNHEMLADVKQLEAALRAQHPEFF